MVEHVNRKPILLLVSISTLFFMFLLFGAIWQFVKHQHEHHMEVTKALARGQMEVISFITQEELQKGNYDSIALLFKQWAGQYVEVDEVELISKNGFMIAGYGPLNPADRRYVTEKEITYSYRGKAKLMMAYSLERAYKLTSDLVFQMILAGLSISFVFSLLFYLFASRRQEADLLTNMVEELKDAESRNKRLAAYPKANPNPIAAFDLDGKETFCNPAFKRLIDLLHAKDSGVLLPDDHDEILRRIGTGENQLYAEVDTGYKHLLLHYQWIDLVEEVYVYIQDVTALRLAEQALIDERNQARTTLTSIADAVVTTDANGRVVYLNDSALKILDQDADSVVGKHFETVFVLLDEELDTQINDLLVQCQLNKSGAVVSQLARLALVDGNNLHVNVTANRILSNDKEMSGIVVVIRDVTRERRLQEELYRQASHDNLTELLNRSAFESHLEQSLESARKRGHQHILCFMDLDQFKVVNDTCGHVAGDELLRQIAAIMRRHFRGSDVLARVGGDEFAAILTDCPLSMAQDRVNGLRKEIQEHTFTWQEHNFRISISIGIVEIDQYSESIGMLMSSVDAACYSAKDSGRNCITVYQRDSSSTTQLLGQMQWVSQINDALSDDRLILYSQPIADLQSNELVIKGIEILVRMRSQEGELIPPGAFLPSAERYDLIDRIDYAVIEKVMQLLAESGADYPDCFINISGMTLSRNELSPKLKLLLEKYQINPQKLVFEVTETAAIQNLTSALKIINELKELGCRFALDDFGSGLSSFGYLKNLPIDFVKIDGMFVKEINKSPVDKGMVEAIKTVADTMGLVTIAEFVEDSLIREELKRIGIYYGQGYSIARPKPIEDYLNSKKGQSNIIWLSS
ncbi:MAG: EAL domain-containing protein [Candidatus Thiodiazotropha taylori]|nr:EAL domain-containing protein [Candidatus Thiodiazotropha taylori]